MAKLAKKKKRKDEASKLLSEFRKIDETVDIAELICRKTDGTKYYFNRFINLKDS